VRFIRRLLKPILKLFFNPTTLTDVLHRQAKINAIYLQRTDNRDALDALYYEVIHNLVLETTRLGIEVKNLKMSVESFSSRLDFDERRARALEGVVQYRPGTAIPRERARTQPAIATTTGGPQGIAGAAAAAPAPAEAGQPDTAAPRRRRRRRRGRRGRGSTPSGDLTAAPPGGAESAAPEEGQSSAAEEELDESSSEPGPDEPDGGPFPSDQ
jgi:hypothetical protein